MAERDWMELAAKTAQSKPVRQAVMIAPESAMTGLVRTTCVSVADFCERFPNAEEVDRMYVYQFMMYQPYALLDVIHLPEQDVTRAAPGATCGHRHGSGLVCDLPPHDVEEDGEERPHMTDIGEEVGPLCWRMERGVLMDVGGGTYQFPPGSPQDDGNVDRDDVWRDNQYAKTEVAGG